MEKNRLFIIISAAVAILSSFLPWASLNAGAFGSYSVNGLNGDGGSSLSWQSLRLFLLA